MRSGLRNGFWFLGLGVGGLVVCFMCTILGALLHCYGFVCFCWGVGGLVGWLVFWWVGWYFACWRCCVLVLVGYGFLW